MEYKTNFVWNINKKWNIKQTKNSCRVVKKQNMKLVINTKTELPVVYVVHYAQMVSCLVLVVDYEL